ncbi:hypothetical protein LLG96_00460 [bacterium]|nr:hypothetical protein [bacterium]
MRINQNISIIFPKYISVLMLWFILLIRPFPVSAKIQFEHFGIQDGLSDNTITAICKDSHGFMWFGTRNGLNRFDGYNYVCFKHDLNDSTTISDNYIQVIFEDSSGVLWIGTINGGLNSYNRETGTFVHYVHDEAGPEGISSNTINSIAEGNDGTLWVGTVFGLNALDLSRVKFRHYFNDPTDSLTINHSNVGCVFSDKKGTIWIGTNSGLNVISHETNTIKRLPDRNKVTSILNQNIIDIVEGDNGILWLSTWGGGLRRFDTKTETYEVFLHDPDNPKSINSNVVGHMSFDNHGILWFGTTQGLHSIDPKNNNIEHYNYDLTDPFSMSGDSIWGVYNDNSGIVWIGTLYGGGNKIVPSKLIYNYYNYTDIYKGTDKINNIHNFCEINSSIWFESTNGLHKFDPGKNTFRSYFFNKGKITGRNIELLLTLYNDNSKQIWLGTSIPGLIRFDIDQDVFTPFTPYKLFPDLQHFNVSVIKKDSEGMLWLSTSLGILKFNPKTETFEKTEIDEKEYQIFLGTTDIISDPDGKRMWIFGNFGLYQLYRKNKELRAIFSNNPESPNLKSNNIYCSLDDGHGSFWIGTDDGLYSYDIKTGKHKRFALFNDSIHSIIKDKQGAIWASTNAGLSCIEPSSMEIYNYNTGDGLPFIDNIDNAMFCGNDGTIYVGGKDGFYTFHPDSMHTGNQPPPVVITSLKIDNVEAEFEKKITETSDITLPYRKAPLMLEFSALDYVNPSKNTFAYTMEGLNSDWIKSGNHRNVTYTNLEPGSYVFWVKAANSQGVWNNEGVSLRITIIPPFWKTLWFKALSIIALFGFIYLGHVIRIRNILRFNKELENRIDERTEELKRNNEKLLNEINEREKAESKIKVLSGLIPICASCKKIRDDKGYWTQIESYIRDHSEADFSHGICPECRKKLYPELNNRKSNGTSETLK